MWLGLFISVCSLEFYIRDNGFYACVLAFCFYGTPMKISVASRWSNVVFYRRTVANE